MAITDAYARVPCSSVIIDRANRQRKDLAITADFKDSIAKRGVLQPIIVRSDMTLVAGERRLTASIELGLKDIPVRFFETLDPMDAAIVELEENLKRSDMSWQDTARAIVALHTAYLSVDPEWTQSRTGNTLGMSDFSISQYLRVGRELSNPRIAAMGSMDTAYNALKRQDERRADEALQEIMDTTRTAIPADGTTTIAPVVALADALAAPADAVTPAPAAPEPAILNVEFMEWIATYSGPTFNFLHCDFPYGVNVFDGKWGDARGDKHYSDTKDVYFALIETLAGNLDKVLSFSAHVLFWFSMEHYEETLQEFRQRMPDIVWQKFPVIWHKTDNVGIMPDPKRGPRRIYETAIIGTRGDRPLVKPVSNVYGCPTDKTYHPSTKPEPMLRHFFSMFVDNGTKLLDPTCGSGSALRAAESMGAQKVLGLERDPEHYANAVRAFDIHMKLRKI